MADQETRARDDARSTDAASETSTTTESTGTGDAGTGDAGTGGAGSGSSSGSSEKGSPTGSDSGSASGDDPDESAGRTPARRSESHAKPQAPTDSDREAQEANRRSFVGGGQADDDTPTGERRRSAVDVGEIVWKIANVLATVIRVVTLVFAVVLVAHIALVVVGVNPTNGVASFLRGFADTVVLGFRDLFVPTDPTIALVVNYGVAAVFWVVVGGFLSAGIRFLAARIN